MYVIYEIFSKSGQKLDIDNQFSINDNMLWWYDTNVSSNKIYNSVVAFNGTSIRVVCLLDKSLSDRYLSCDEVFVRIRNIDRGSSECITVNDLYSRFLNNHEDFAGCCKVYNCGCVRFDFLIVSISIAQILAGVDYLDNIVAYSRLEIFIKNRLLEMKLDKDARCLHFFHYKI